MSRDLFQNILVLGATGVMGAPVARQLSAKGHRVRALVRSLEKARTLLPAPIEIVEGSADRPADLADAITGCEAVHVSLPVDVESQAVRYILAGVTGQTLKRISFVSGTTVCEANTWFSVVDVKWRVEIMLRTSGIAWVVFCPTWAMDVLPNFVHGKRAIVIKSPKAPKLHFLAAEDFGRIVAVSYDDDRAVGKRLFVHGPEAMTLPHALTTYFGFCHPDKQIMTLKTWQAKLVARMTGRARMRAAVDLIEYFDRVGEIGDPAATDALYGTPTTTLGAWMHDKVR